MSQRPRLQWHRWIGVYAADWTLEGVRARCIQLGASLATRNASCLIVYDTRFLSAAFARYAFLTLQSQGVAVSLCAQPAPLSTVEFALEQRRADCALVVSAGNAPHWYNGLLLLSSHADISLEGVVPLDTVPEPVFPPDPFEPSERTQVDLRTPYLGMLRTLVDIDLIRRSSLTVFVDAMNGTTSGYVPALLGDGVQTKAVEINREFDPLFARQTPQPAEANLQRLRKLVKESDSHLGVALSADGRALGVTDNTGELATPTEVALLLGQYLARNYRTRGMIIVPALADDTPLRNWEQATGLKIESHAEPAPRIAALLAQDRGSLLAGVTASGELSLGRSSVAPDALLAAMLLIELVARSGGKLRVHLDEIRTQMRGASASQPKP